MDDDAIRTLVARLGRAHSSGGTVIERAAIVAEGVGSDAVLAWITAHGGKPEAEVQTTVKSGLYGARPGDRRGSEPRTPSRYILPAGALDLP